MILEVHVAFMIASLAVLFGITYTIGQFLERRIEDLKAKKAKVEDPDTDLVESETVYLS